MQADTELQHNHHSDNDSFEVVQAINLVHKRFVRQATTKKAATTTKKAATTTKKAANMVQVRNRVFEQSTTNSVIISSLDIFKEYMQLRIDLLGRVYFCRAFCIISLYLKPGNYEESGCDYQKRSSNDKESSSYY